MAFNNPYLEEFNKLSSMHKRHGPIFDHMEKKMPRQFRRTREKLTSKYAWAVPTERAIEKIVSHSSQIFEYGAGNGYWAYLLEQKGARVRCSDIRKPNSKEWHKINTNSMIARENETMMICWPERGMSWPLQMLNMYEGNIVVYIGEFLRGNAEPNFFMSLFERWQLRDIEIIPQWYNRSDLIYIFYRSV